MVNPKTKPIPIKSKPIATKSSSTSSPLSSSSSSNASPQTSSSSANISPSIQTLIVQNSKNRGSFPRSNVSASNLHTSKSTGSVPPATKGNSLAATSSATSLNLSTLNSSSRDGSGTTPRTSDTTGSSSSTVSVYPPVSNGNGTTSNGHISSDILDDLASRFIINVPDDERNNLIRICFQIELAHWFYLDFFCANDEKKCGMKQFAMSLFQHIPFLKTHLPVIDKILENWKQYKLTVPTYGAVLLSEDLRHVLLVQSFWAKSSWGFPKGKVNENEDPIHCAAREVFEETGYDITHLIVQSEYIESIINDQYTRLYLVRNVPLKTQFSPRTRKEIKCCEWFSIDSLPISKNDANTKQHLGINANSFFMIMPFVKRLKKWVNEKRSCTSDKQGTATAPQASKTKFLGQYSSSIYNYNNPFLVNKKTDMKLPFKPSLAAVAAGTSRTFFTQASNLSSSSAQKNASGTNNNIKASSSNGKSASSKRQRHKSMGDLDGVVRSEQSSDCYHNNLKLPMNNTRRQNQTNTSSIFNDLSWPAKTPPTSSDLSEQRDTNSKPNSRRHRLANSIKNSEISGKMLLTNSTSASASGAASESQKPTTTDTEALEPSVSAIIASFSFDCAKKNNLDISKISKQIKSNNIETNLSNGYTKQTRSARSATNDSSRSSTEFSTTPRPASARQSGEKNMNYKRDAFSSSEQDSSAFNGLSITIAASTRQTPMHLFKSTQTNPFLPLPRSPSSLTTTEPAQINCSPNFDRWLDFSFTKNCITNVFC